MGEKAGAAFGLGALVSATAGCFTYGLTRALDVHLPAMEYVLPATVAAAMYSGSQLGLPDNDSEGAGCLFYAVGVTAISAICYGAGNGLGHLVKQ